MYPVEGIAGGYRDPPPHGRVVHVGERDPHLEYWVAWLSHTSDPADCITAQLGEPSRIGLAVEDHDAEHVQSGHRDRDVRSDCAPQRVMLELGEADQHVPGLDRVAGDAVEFVQRKRSGQLRQTFPRRRGTVLMPLGTRCNFRHGRGLAATWLDRT